MALWKSWRPGEPLYVVGWQDAPGHVAFWSISPDPERAGWMTDLSSFALPFDGPPEEALRALVDCYNRAGMMKPGRDAAAGGDHG